MARFAVDDVTPASSRLPVHPLRQDTPDALFIGGDPDTPVIDHGPTHALLGAVSLAFAQHRPLVLSPDAVWLTIAQGVAQHVRLHAERLRGRLVRHAGTKRLVVSSPVRRTTPPTGPRSSRCCATRSRAISARARLGCSRARSRPRPTSIASPATSCCSMPTRPTTRSG